MSFEIDFEEEEDLGLGGLPDSAPGAPPPAPAQEQEQQPQIQIKQEQGLHDDPQMVEQEQGGSPEQDPNSASFFDNVHIEGGPGTPPEQEPDMQVGPGPQPSSQALREARESGQQVYLANLQWWTTDAEVEAICSDFGPVAGLKFIEDRATGKSKGVVLVEFVDADAAARCKEQLSGRLIGGRSCVVTFANKGGPPPSHRERERERDRDRDRGAPGGPPGGRGDGMGQGRGGAFREGRGGRGGGRGGGGRGTGGGPGGPAGPGGPGGFPMMGPNAGPMGPMMPPMMGPGMPGMGPGMGPMMGMGPGMGMPPLMGMGPGMGPGMPPLGMPGFMPGAQ